MRVHHHAGVPSRLGTIRDAGEGAFLIMEEKGSAPGLGGRLGAKEGFIDSVPEGTES